MCGISGIINKDNRVVNSEQIKKINDLIIHRGPDDEGFYFGNNFAFGHRRLSIIDLSSSGHQPMSYLNRYIITYNGEIYNYIELKEVLLKEGYSFKSHTDTEVILACFDRWGENCVERFNGMWAFAIYDKEKDTIFCSRDRFGIKPFYYADMENNLFFGSEIKQILPLFEKNYVDKSVMLDYLSYTLEGHNEKTFFKDIKKIPPGYNLLYDLKSHKFQLKQYYCLRTRLKAGLDNIRDLETAIEDSILLRLRSDIQVGTCLSGGLDSSTITALAAKNNKSDRKIISITVSSIDKSNDETDYAKTVADNSDIIWYTTKPENQDFIEHLERVLEVQEEPFYDPSIYMEYFVMKKAKESGITVLLDGQGSDEILFGYEHNYQVLLSSLLRKLKFIEFFTMYRKVKTFRSSKLKVLVQSFLSMFTIIRAYRLYKKSYLKKEYRSFKEFRKNYKFLDILEYQINQVIKTNIPRYLKYQDKSSMSFSIESRVPFLDYRVVESSLMIDSELKFKDGYLKYPLRKIAEKLLPASIAWRTDKIGYEAPNRFWLKEIETTMDKSIKESSILRHFINTDTNKLSLNQKWKLFTVSFWEKKYNVKL